MSDKPSMTYSGEIRIDIPAGKSIKQVLGPQTHKVLDYIVPTGRRATVIIYLNAVEEDA